MKTDTQDDSPHHEVTNKEFGLDKVPLTADESKLSDLLAAEEDWSRNVTLLTSH
jgi:hypothetical protein